VIAFLRQNNFEIGPCLARLFALLRAWAEAHGVPPVAAHGITMLVQTSVLIGLISLVPIILVYAERKVSAFMQARLGPMETGP